MTEILSYGGGGCRARRAGAATGAGAAGTGRGEGFSADFYMDLFCTAKERAQL